MKKSFAVLGLSLVFSSAAFADDGHTNWENSVDKFKGTITQKDKFEDVIKYTDLGTQAKLRKAFSDGKLTSEEIKASGISDHHFYTGLLASSRNQSEYDKNLKMLNLGQNMDDKFVSNRDLKAHGSMMMNQVDTKVQAVVSSQTKVDGKQNDRMDKIVDGMHNLYNQMQAQVPSLPSDGSASYDDTEVKDSIQNNSNNIAAMGDAFEQRVDQVNDYLSQAGTAIQSNSNKIDSLGQAFAAQAAHTTSEIARLDGRIDSLEKKTDKLKAGVAGANAIGSLTQYTGSGTHHVAVGIGGYEGASALAGGYTYAVSYNTTIRATVAYDSEGDFGFGASVGHSW